MTRERWEVRHVRTASGGMFASRSLARECWRRMWPRGDWAVVRVRTWRVVSAWAWRAGYELAHYGAGWWSDTAWGYSRAARTLYPTRAAALAARPSADAVLVRIRRRVP